MNCKSSLKKEEEAVEECCVQSPGPNSTTEIVDKEFIVVQFYKGVSYSYCKYQ